MDSIIEYSLNTPKYHSNILDSKIINLLKRENLHMGGSGFENNSTNSTDCIVMIIGIIIIIVGFYLCWNKNDFISVNGQIKNVSCDTSNSNYFSNYFSECKFNITYIVDNVQYSKVVSLDKSSVPSTNTIPIYYKESDPNIMQLYNYNYSIIGIILIIIGAFVLISSLCCSSNLIQQLELQLQMQTQSETETTGTNLYSNSKNVNGILYTKM